uniref:alpha-1,3-mannosyl-glycoprotein 4-beta-N-acetylglucosaminyltransferase A-like isoform X2 n=1 Tax=Styela clava TaxID=7725 RepID=UPI0019395BC7|nr:alpha-1,3-mannosyl-glycoprotein 4-beta-N-acetylglucosaminyltransferase A-like isoform X2 [Styela clava]
MISELLVGSSRIWVAILALYTCAMVYGLMSLNGDTSSRAGQVSTGLENVKTESVKDRLLYDYDPFLSSSENVDPELSIKALEHLPSDFPLSGGLAKPKPFLKAGNAKKNATVVIGIPSIKRQGNDYLISTIESLLRHLTPEQKKETVFMIFLGESDTSYLDDRVQELQKRFPDESMSGSLEAIESKKNRPWIYLSFCGLGAIGKLFRRRTLPLYASFIHSFWNAKPLDWLQVDFARSRICSYDETEKTCFKRLKSVTPEAQPSLFQHIGKVSSLPGKIQKLRDGRFRQ